MTQILSQILQFAPGSVVLAGFFVLQMESIVNLIVDHHAHDAHVEERSYPGILARDVLGSVHVHQSPHRLKETNISRNVPWKITDMGITDAS